MSILIKNIELDNRLRDILIQDNRIEEIAENINTETDYRIDGRNKAAMPGLYNSHTHAAMTLFRGYADDMPLMEWLTRKIWPNEARLTEKEVYCGTRLACLEMIKSGTLFFNDMYWKLPGSYKAVKEMGIRAALSSVLIDNFDPQKAKEEKANVIREYRDMGNKESRLLFSLGPHAPYTVSEELLGWAGDFAEKHGLLIHVHLSETEDEVKDSIKRYGLRPAEYLDRIGFLGPNVVAAHSVWLNNNEIKLLEKNKVNVVYNPVSNMKLSVGRAFNFDELSRKVNVTIGTDGCSSNNNLDMFEEMKTAALLQKFVSGSTVSAPAKQMLDCATRNPAKAFGINGGAIEEGRLADIILVDLGNAQLVPHHDLVSNLVYSANGSCVDTMICDGRILMQDRIVGGEDKIINEARETAAMFFSNDN